jgi:hypothetical protein
MTAAEHEKRQTVTVTEEWARLGNLVLYRQKIGDTDWEDWRELKMAWPFADHVATIIEQKLFPANAERHLRLEAERQGKGEK